MACWAKCAVTNVSTGAAEVGSDDVVVSKSVKRLLRSREFLYNV